jgi:hypothetical protein
VRPQATQPPKNPSTAESQPTPSATPAPANSGSQPTPRH